MQFRFVQHSFLFVFEFNVIVKKGMRDMVESNVNGSYIMYKNKPLVREDNIICYGDMEEKYILQLIIMTEKEQNGKKVPDKVVVQLMSTDKTLSQSQRVVKQDLKDGFKDAFELGLIWLERYLAA